MYFKANVACRELRSWATTALLILSACTAISPPQVDGIRCASDVRASAQSTTLIAFAGWKVTADDAWHWGQALATVGFATAPPALRCAARGPQDASYQKKDIDTGALAEALIAHPPAGDITVVAHSSGSFVAQHFFRQLRDKGGASLLAHIHYVNLDGAIGEGERSINADVIAALASVRAVYAIDLHPGSESANASSMRRLHALAPERVKLIALPVPDAGCNRGAKWCLHNALINRKPYNPASFDLKRDYGEINAAHPVEASYLRAN